MASDRIAVVGDIGGHHDELYAALIGLGADPDPATWQRDGWPDDLVVVQVGDLVDRGPDSDGVLDLVDAAPPSRWIQLAGNHECRYLGGPGFNDVWASAQVRSRVRNLDLADRLAVAALLVTDELGDVVVTHAGCTRGFLDGNGLDRLPVRRVVATMNHRWAERGVRSRAPLWRAGMMLSGRFGSFPDPMVGPIWAAAAGEMWPSWAGHAMPFAQIHGHSTPLLWAKDVWIPMVHTMIAQDIAATGGEHAGDGSGGGRYGADRVRRHAWWRPAGGPVLIALDPQHWDRPAPSWAPFVVHGTATTPGMPPPQPASRFRRSG